MPLPFCGGIRSRTIRAESVVGGGEDSRGRFRLGVRICSSGSASELAVGARGFGRMVPFGGRPRGLGAMGVSGCGTSCSDSSAAKAFNRAFTFAVLFLIRLGLVEVGWAGITDREVDATEGSR